MTLKTITPKHFSHLHLIGGKDPNSSADAIPVADVTHQFNPQPVIEVASLVAQQGRCGVVVYHGQIEIAIVVVVALGRRATGRFELPGCAGPAAHFYKVPVLILIEQVALSVGQSRSMDSQLRINVAVNYI